MRGPIILIAAVVALYIISSLALTGIYGDSYSGGVFADEHRWEPDGQGGWVARGKPAEPQPAGTSEVVPLWIHYLPIFLPGALMALFLFTPLSRKLEKPIADADPSELPDGPKDGTADS